MQFRFDINGLRAYAVIAVVIYHFNSQWLSGGFAGVDVFFVISGYLMTSIILKGISTENFSIMPFYMARAKRIIPALFIMCLAVLLLGWFILSPIEFKDLGKHTAASAGFVSNLIYWKESGYFSASSHSKWLLHTWSLSVEWQFYLIYPVLLVILSKVLSLRQLSYLILMTVFINLLYCINISLTDSNSAFYLLSTRAWEMLAGGVAFLFPIKLKKIQKHLLEIIGVSLVLASYFYFTSLTIWPGYAATIPVLGALLILTANNQKSIFTNNKLCQLLGNASYSIYLWHWPVVVYMTYLSLDSYISIFSGILISIVLGFISYHFIEKKLIFSFNKPSIKKVLIYKPFLFSGVLILLGATVYLTKGATFRYSTEQQLSMSHIYDAIGDWGYPDKNMNIGNLDIRYVDGSSNINTLFIGDSLIEQYYPKARALSKSELGNVWFLTESGCMPLKDIFEKRWLCKNGNYISQLLLSHKFDNIIVGGAWELYLGKQSPFFLKEKGEVYSFTSEEGQKIVNSKVDDFFTLLLTETNNIHFILPTPMGSMFDPKQIIKKVMLNDKSYLKGYEKQEFYKKNTGFYSIMNDISQKFNINLIDPIKSLCPTKKCYVTDGSDIPFYKDATHLRPAYVINNVDFLDDIAN